MIPTPAYELGRGRPPIETRFQPGRSGNPRGRPSKPKRDYRGTYGAAWFDEVVLDEVYRHVPVSEEGRTFYLTTLQAAVRAIGAAAAKGSRLHARLLFELTDRIESRRAAQRTAILDDALDTKAQWADLAALAEQHAQPVPEPPCPHPDSLRIDPRTGLVATDDLLPESPPHADEPAAPEQPAADPPADPTAPADPAAAPVDTPPEQEPPAVPDEAPPPPRPADSPPHRSLPPGVAFSTLRTVLAHNRRWYRGTSERLANTEPEPPPPPPKEKAWDEYTEEEQKEIFRQLDEMY
jgi:hypothetical protein